jgi:hypothetical protein
MKAIYQKPSTEFMSTTMSQLMVASLPEKVEDGFNPNDTPTTDQTSGNLSRRKVWDDEDEEF